MRKQPYVVRMLGQSQPTATWRTSHTGNKGSEYLNHGKTCFLANCADSFGFYVLKFWNIRLWDFCQHPQHNGGDWNSACGVQSVEKLQLTNLRGTSISRKNVSVALNNPQTSLRTVFIGTTFYWRNSPSAGCPVRSVDCPVNQDIVFWEDALLLIFYNSVSTKIKLYSPLL